MAYRFTVKQIAAQAGVSAATVDRVRHGRAHVHDKTRYRVNQAIAELEAQVNAHIPLGLGVTIDVVLNSPQRFTNAVREAFLNAASELAPFRVAPRFHAKQQITPGDLAGEIHRIAKKRTHGLILKAADHPAVIEAVNEISARNIPVVTFATDICRSERIAYVGMDNSSAGRTAAFLLGRIIGRREASVLASLGSWDFYGETERWRGFLDLMGHQFRNIRVVTMDGGYGSDGATYELAREQFSRYRDVAGIYSMGGGNQGLLRAVSETTAPGIAFVGHDLDAENRRLLKTGRIDAVVDHDLHGDARDAIRHVLRHRQQGCAAESQPSRPVIVTPWNVS